MTKTRVLFLYDGVWDLGRRSGMAVKFLTLERAAQAFQSTLITTDQLIGPSDLPGVRLVKVWFPLLSCPRYVPGHRYWSYALHRLRFFLLSLYYVLIGVRFLGQIDVIYCSSSTTILAGFILASLGRAKLVSRAYGTFLAPKLGRPLALLGSFQECLSFLLPADAYVVTNDGTFGDKVARAFSVPSAKLHFWRNGIEHNEFVQNRPEQRRYLRNKLSIDSNCFVVMTVSRLERWKRVERSILAVQHLPKTVHLAIVGDGPDRSRLESLSQAENIHFLGPQPQAEVRKLLAGADAFASMYDLSNVGNPLFEALSAGVPVVALNTGDTSSVIADGANGILIEAASEESIVKNLAQQLARLAAEPNLCAALAAGGIQFTANNMKTWEQRLAVEMDLIDSLVPRNLP